MQDKTHLSDKFERLRRQAEALLKDRSLAASPPTEDVLALVYELEVQQVELELQNEELRKAQLNVSDLHREFEDLYDFAPCAYLNLSPKGLITRINLFGVKLLGQERVRILDSAFSRYVTANLQEAYFEALAMSARTGERHELELQLASPENHPWVWAQIQPDRDQAGVVIQWRMALTDISPLKRVENRLRENEKTLEKSREELEIKVRERTADLQRVNQELSLEIESRKQAQSDLLAKSRALEKKTFSLAETNAALKVLLKNYEKQRNRLEEKVAANINEFTRPQLAKLQRGNLTPRQRSLLEAVLKNLDQITSPMTKLFVMEGRRLTPTEIQVAELIRQGRSTKEIAETMGVATSTVEYHRLNIRKRLRLINKNVNLQSYLQSLL